MEASKVPKQNLVVKYIRKVIPNMPVQSDNNNQEKSVISVLNNASDMSNY